MTAKKKENSKIPKLKKIVIEKQETKNISIIKNFFEKYGKLTTIKLLLVKINDLLKENKLNFVYRAVQNKSIMYIYLFDCDLMISLIKPMTVTNPKQQLELDDITDKKVIIRITQISSYGNYMTNVYFKDEELQNYLKKLYHHLIESYYNKLNKIDQLIDKNLLGNKGGEDNIITLVSEEVYNTFNDESIVNNALKKFNSVTENDIKRSSGIHKLFF